MAGDRSLERRVTRLENDRDSLYELLVPFRSETETRFDRIEARLDGHDRRFDGIDQRFDGIDTTLAEILRRLPEPT